MPEDAAAAAAEEPSGTFDVDAYYASTQQTAEPVESMTEKGGDGQPITQKKSRGRKGKPAQSAKPITVNTDFSMLEKKIQLVKQKYKCNICKEPLDIIYEIDHIIPKFKGGEAVPKNCQALCPRCHAYKTKNDRARGPEWIYTFTDGKWQGPQ
jgi:hypothetical protein